jgi:hypothetical protein
VPGCAEAPCKIINGKTYTLEMEFDAIFSAKTLTNHVIAYFMGFDTGYKIPIELQNACAGIKCPLSAGQKVKYSVSAPVESPKNGVEVTLEYSLTNEKGDVLLCYKSPVEIE